MVGPKKVTCCRRASTEIRKAILDFKRANGEISGEKHLIAKEKEVNAMTDTDLKKFMAAYKAKLSPYYSTHIAALSGKRSIPPVIRGLFEVVVTGINEVPV